MYTVRKFAGELQLVTDTTGFRQLYVGSIPITGLGKKDLHVLEVLLTPPQEIHTRTEIFTKVWGELERGDEVITTAVANIRSIALKGQYRNLIETIQSRTHLKRDGGYRYNGSVETSNLDVLPDRRSKARHRPVPGNVPPPVGPGEAVVDASSQATTHAIDLNITSVIREMPVAENLASNPSNEQRTGAKTRSQEYWLYSLIAVVLLATVAIWRARSEISQHALQIQPILRQSRDIHIPMVTDGTQLYFSECMGNRFRLARVNIQATETESTILSTTVRNPDLSDISPDGNYLLIREVPRFINDSALFYAQPTDGRPPVLLGGIRGLDGTWSRDGKRIYFSESAKIYVANSDGSNPKIFLDHLAGDPFWLRWSPDGTILRFSLIQGHIYTIWEKRLIDSQPRQLELEADGGTSRCCGNWNSAGTRYFYQTSVNGVYQIWARQEPSGQLIPFKQELEDHTGPTPARTGNVLFIKSENRRAELERIDYTTHAATTILPTVSISMAAVSPDGQLIAYSTFPLRSLYVSRLDGAEKRPLTDPSVGAVLPVWSPDGSQIAYMTRIHGWWQVYIVSAKGGDAKPLLEGDANPISDPTWSPEGRQVLIGYGPTIKNRPETMALYVVDLDSRKLGNRIPDSDGLFSPRWSPDGRYIAALSANASKLLLYNSQTGWRVIVDNAKLGYPNWSADSHTLYVEETREDKNLIKRIHVPDLKIETFADLSSYQQPCTIFGNWVGIDHNLPLFTKDGSTRLVGGFKYTTP